MREHKDGVVAQPSDAIRAAGSVDVRGLDERDMLLTVGGVRIVVSRETARALRLAIAAEESVAAVDVGAAALVDDLDQVASVHALASVMLAVTGLPDDEQVQLWKALMTVCTKVCGAERAAAMAREQTRWPTQKALAEHLGIGEAAVSLVLLRRP